MPRPAKLTPAQVQRVREWARNRKPAKVLAHELGISRKRLYAYLQGRVKTYA